MLAITGIGQAITEFFTPDRISMLVRVALILGIGLPLLSLIKKITVKLTQGKLSPQSEQLIQRAVYYLGFLVLVVTLLNEFGFKLSALLGAAGVLGIAIGFASQTSVSNIISGIFLISEKPFVVGDVIDVAGTIGTVASIDLLSIKLRTPDNRFVRVPNENMIKTEVINITRYDTRRVNINVSVDYSSDMIKVLQILDNIANTEDLALKDPKYISVVDAFADSGINILFGVWGKTEDYWTLRNNLMLRVKQEFENNGISIPYPHVQIVAQNNKEQV